MLRRTILTSRILACVSDNAAHLLFRCLGGDSWMPRATRVDSSLARDGALFIALAPDREQTLMSCGRSRVTVMQTLPQENFTIGESFWRWFSES